MNEDKIIKLLKTMTKAICRHQEELNKLTQEIIKLNERIEDATTSPRGGQQEC